MVTSFAALGCSSTVVPAPDGGAAGQGTALPDDFPTLNGCEPSDYEDRSADAADRSVAVGADGLVFTPRCMLIGVGQGVVFEGSLSAHPLAPGNPADPSAGSAKSPIVETSSGSSVSFTFPSAGTFPYYCTMHAFGAGMGMAGAIHVVVAPP